MTIGATPSPNYAYEGSIGYINGYNPSLPATNQKNIGQSVQAFLITAKNGSNSAVDLRGETGKGGAIDAIFRVLPQGILAYYIANTAAGTISLLVDGVNAPQAAALQVDLRNLGSSVGVGPVDLAGTTVASATTLAVS
jgi:hypothetical protein